MVRQAASHHVSIMSLLRQALSVSRDAFSNFEVPTTMSPKLLFYELSDSTRNHSFIQEEDARKFGKFRSHETMLSFVENELAATPSYGYTKLDYTEMFGTLGYTFTI